jgi:NAD(P)-dependent dehydrogenase (short-subunit alcohol dehydrogenase family)
MDLELGGKVAVVTGSSDGIGRAVAERLAAEGAAVTLCARRPEPLAAVVAGIEAAGGQALGVPADVGQPGAIERVIAAAVERFGGLDILVNNAGRSAAAPFDQVDDAGWAADLDLKFHAAVRGVRAALPHLRARGGGRIVNVVNIGGKAPGAGSVPTSVSRAAGLALTKALSKDLAADNITVNAVCIGSIKSGQWVRRWQAAGQPGTLDDFYAGMARQAGIPLGRVGETSEAADLIAFLVSARAAYITGTAINLDGGTAATL